MRFVVIVCLFACFLEIALGQAIGFNGLGIPNNLPLGNNLAPNLPVPNGLLGNAISNPAAAVAASLPQAGLPMTPASGYGDVVITGELPVGGTTAVVGNVPIIGFVTFEGIVPANGIVSLASNCGCNSVY